MAFCPNPDCPHRRRSRRPAEYREGHSVCADCGTPLVAEPPSLALPPRLGWPPPLLARLLLTAAALFLVWLLGFIPLPGLDPQAAAQARAEGAEFGFTMLGIRPLLVSLVLVELGALALPWTRARRRHDPHLRRVLWWVGAALALPIAWAQGLAVAFTLEQYTWGWHDYLVISPGWFFRLGIATLLALATGGLALLVRWLDRHGLGPGLAALLLLDAAGAGVHGLARLGREVVSGALTPLGAVLTLGAVAAAVAAAAWVLGRRPRWAPGLPAGLPVTGLLPLELALLVVMIPTSLASMTGHGQSPLLEALGPGRPAGLLLTAAVILLATPLAATLFHWRRRAWWRGPERGAWLGLMAASAGLVLAVAAADFLALRSTHAVIAVAPLGAISLLAGVALALDAWDEIGIRRRAAGAAPRLLREDQDLADALEALDTLRREDPRGHYVLCGRRFRSLTYFFGPYVPLRILGVPAEPPG
ncbi:MAG: hypothetical protein ABIO70_09180 [Pseudomonadota bacterium]